MSEPASDIQFVDELWRVYPHTYAEKASEHSAERWIAYNYLQIISKEIAKAVANGGGKLIVEVPPRHGKSTLISLWTPIWFLDMFPNKKVMLATYAAEFSAKWGRAVRDEIISNPLVKVKVKKTSSAASRWDTEEGGGMVTAGIGGAVTGKGGHLIIIDDPVKNWEEASSAVYRQRNIDWMKSTMRTRAEPGCVIVVLQTRWHQQDLAGKLQEEDLGYKVLRFPALAEANDILGREEGEPLCPNRYDKADLLSIMKDIGSKFWNALFQQRPSPEGGDIFQRSWFKFYDELPAEIVKFIQSWDPSRVNKKKSAFCVGQVWGQLGADCYLVDQFREKMGYVKARNSMRNMHKKWPQCREILVEAAANGDALIDDLKGEIPGIIGINPRGGKVERAEAVAPMAEAGNVWLPNPQKNAWVQEFIEEACTFPNSDYADQVDTMTQALARMKPKAVNKLVSPVGIGKSSSWRNI